MAHFLCICVLVIAGLAQLGGCASTINAIFDRTVVEHHISKNDPMTALALKADRRLVIFSRQESLNCCGKMETSYFAISEPSPDAFAEITTLLEVIASAKGTLKKDALGEADLDTQLKILDKISTRIARLGVRSQGLSFLRDGGFRLAEAYMNGMVSNADYKCMMDKLVVESAKLVKLELEKNPTLASSSPTGEKEWEDVLSKIEDLKKVLDPKSDSSSTDTNGSSTTPTTKPDKTPTTKPAPATKPNGGKTQSGK